MASGFLRPKAGSLGPMRQNLIRTLTNHPYTGRDEPANQRFSMFAIAWPIPRPQKSIGGLSQADALIAQIERVECEQIPSHAFVSMLGPQRTTKCTDRSKLIIKTPVVGNIETKGDRSRCHSALEHIEPDRGAATIYRQMLAFRPTHPSWCDHLRVEQAFTIIVRFNGPDGEHARVYGPRPQG
jgi:hypothetical protein